jgi:hypothetical protein
MLRSSSVPSLLLALFATQHTGQEQRHHGLQRKRAQLKEHHRSTTVLATRFFSGLSIECCLGAWRRGSLIRLSPFSIPQIAGQGAPAAHCQQEPFKTGKKNREKYRQNSRRSRILQ